MKYIDAECLKAHIQHLIKKDNYELFDVPELLSFIDTLQQEQPDVNLEKEINSLDDIYFDLDGIAVVGATYYITVEDLKDIARHFYELGFNARKE